MMGSSQNWPFIINLGNSIIGVALLAMPFCFQKCGILLSMLVLLFCTWLTLISCHMLMKAGINSRRRSYEFLAYYTHGATGKFVSEIGMIGFQLGTLIAQIVVIGDLGPAIVTKIFGIENSPGLRTALMILLCMTIGLPMALIRDIRAISRVSTVCVAFYCCFVLYVLWLAFPNLLTGSWYDHVHFWRPQGLFQCLPILSFSFGCQTQLFLLYDALPEPSLKVMSKVVNCAVNMCAVGYLMVGFCGYVAFYSLDVPGDVIGIFPNTGFTDLMKVCFVFSIVITFPVMIFPCRASIYTLLYAKHNEDGSFYRIDDEKKSKARDDVIDLDTYIPAKQLKIITTSLVVGSTIIGILIPNVEFILGMNGAIMGTLICYIFPALFSLKVMGSKPEGRNKARFVLFVGVTILLVSTYATLSSHDKGKTHIEKLAPEVHKPIDLDFENVLLPKHLDATESKGPPVERGDSAAKQSDEQKDEDNAQGIKDVRQEPPNPDPPDNRAKPPDNSNSGEKKDVKRDLVNDGAIIAKESDDSGNLAAANKAMELELQQKGKKQDELLAQLEKQRIEQKNLIEEQKQLLKEFKDHHEKDMQQGGYQQHVDVQQNPTVQQPQPNAQPQAGPEQPLVPQKNLQDTPPHAPLIEQPKAILLDSANQQPKEEQQMVNQISKFNNSLKAQQLQGQQSLISQPPPQYIQQKLDVPQQQQQDSLQQKQNIQQQPNSAQQQDIQQQLNLAQQQDIQQQPNSAQQQDIQQQLNLAQQQQDLLQQDKEKNNAENQNLQQKLEDLDNLNRDKRDVIDQSLIVNVTKLAQSIVKENSNFDKDKLAHLTNDKKSEATIKENTLVAKQVKITEKESDVNVSVLDVASNETQKPKANVEMRRKLKYDSSVYQYTKDSTFDSSVHYETVMAVGSRSLLDILEGIDKPEE